MQDADRSEDTSSSPVPSELLGKHPEADLTAGMAPMVEINATQSGQPERARASVKTLVKAAIATVLAAAFMLVGITCALFLGSLGPFKMPLAGLAFVAAALTLHIIMAPARATGIRATKPRSTDFAGLIKSGVSGLLVMGTLAAGSSGLLFVFLNQGNSGLLTIGAVCIGLACLQIFLIFMISRIDPGSKL